MIENFAIILSLVFPIFLNNEILALVVDRQDQPAIIAYLEDDPKHLGESESVTTAENSLIEVISDGCLYFLKTDLQDAMVRIWDGLANNDSEGNKLLSSKENWYAGQGFSDWVIINGDYLAVEVYQMSIASKD